MKKTGMMTIKLATSLLLLSWLLQAESYEVIEVINGGGLEGRVTFSSGRIRDSLVKVGTHAEYCGEWVNPGRLVLSGDSGVKNAVVMITRIYKGKEFEPDKHLLVHNVNCGFSPRISITGPNGSISLKNGDKIFHRVRIGLWDSRGGTKNIMAMAVPWIEKKISIIRIREHMGLISLTGIVHPFEQGWIWRLPHPYAAVTDDNGRFKISDIPQGKYNIRIWHELLGDRKKNVKVQKGETSLLNIDFKS